MLLIDNITYSYSRKRKPVLSDYSLMVDPGTICGLLGPNGAGKSTLLYLITGLLRPQQGVISFDGFIPTERKVDFLNKVFIIPEEFSLPNVKLSEFVKSTSPFYPNFSIETFKSTLGIFEMNPDIHLGQLSMGQKKRVFISFAIACNTELLILDEPTNGLDIPGKRLFRKAILNGMTDEKTVIISTHQVYDIEKILDHIVITDYDGVRLDASVNEITSRLTFDYTNNREVAEGALLSLDAPGGYNIINQRTPDTCETEINLESLFELANKQPEVVRNLFNKIAINPNLR